MWSATGLVVGHTIGVGIFLTPAQLIGGLASPALTLGLWLVCGALVLAGALTFGELAGRYPHAGGPYVYLREAWGPRAAFIYGWQSLLVMDPALIAALATGLSQYVVVLVPATAGAERWMAVSAIWALALINMAGLRVSGRVLAAMTTLKVLALAAVVLAAFTVGRGSWSHFVPFGGGRVGGAPLGEALALGLVSVFFSFGGFWDASRMAGDVRSPGRTLPLALSIGVAGLTLIYVMTTAAFMYLVPPGVASSPAEFARTAGVAMIGPAGPSMLAAVVVVSVVASAMAFLLMAPRLYVAMGRDGLFPATLAAVHPGTETPVRALTLLACLASVFAWFGRFDQIVALMICPTLGFIALAAAGLSVVRERPSEDGVHFETPGYPWTPTLFVLLVSGVVVLVALSRPWQAALGFTLVLLGLPAYRWFSASARR